MTKRMKQDGQVGLLSEKTRPKLKKPKMYKVLILNDDFTPMDFVVDVLKVYFSMDNEMATQLMLKVHYTGRAICGVYTRDIAETKVAQVNEYARDHQHPLMCSMEVE